MLAIQYYITLSFNGGGGGKLLKCGNPFSKTTAHISDKINDCKSLTDLCFVVCEGKHNSVDQIKISLFASFGS